MELKEIDYEPGKGFTLIILILLYDSIRYNQGKIHPCITVLSFWQFCIIHGCLNLMGITSPYPRKNIIAVNYILANTQAHQSKRHRQQNNENWDKAFILNRWVLFYFQLNQQRLLHQLWVSRLTEEIKNFIRRLYLYLSAFRYT